MGKVIDINTGEVLGETRNLSAYFELVVDDANITREVSHLRAGRQRLREGRQFIKKMASKGVDVVYDPKLPSDAVFLVVGTPEEWKEERFGT